MRAHSQARETGHTAHHASTQPDSNPDIQSQIPSPTHTCRQACTHTIIRTQTQPGTGQLEKLELEHSPLLCTPAVGPLRVKVADEEGGGPAEARPTTAAGPTHRCTSAWPHLGRGLRPRPLWLAGWALSKPLGKPRQHSKPAARRGSNPGLPSL